MCFHCEAFANRSVSSRHNLTACQAKIRIVITTMETHGLAGGTNLQTKKKILLWQKLAHFCPTRRSADFGVFYLSSWKFHRHVTSTPIGTRKRGRGRGQQETLPLRPRRIPGRVCKWGVSAPGGQFAQLGGGGVSVTDGNASWINYW